MYLLLLHKDKNNFYKTHNKCLFIYMKEDILHQFGNRVKELRTQSKLTQEQFAQKTRLHKNYIGMVERGERNPSLINIQVIAKGLEISISELMRF